MDGFPLRHYMFYRDVINTMAGPLFPSGPWVGFYTYKKKSTHRFLMDLNLRFHNGKIDGEGADGLDTFIIVGTYDGQKLECAWQKIYPTRSSVSYQGYREGKGIWGRWKLSTIEGGFHIWPLSEGAPPDLSRLEEEQLLENVKSEPYILVPMK
jgi:hypothetical protein